MHIEKPCEGSGAAYSLEIVGSIQRQEVNRTFGRAESSAFRMGEKRYDRSPVTELREECRGFQSNSLPPAQALSQLVNYEKYMR